MSATHAMFRNQLVAIEPVVTDGSCNLTITCPVNETGYMQALESEIQNWQPLLKGGGNGQQGRIATDAQIENNQVICSLTAEQGSISEAGVQTLAEDLGDYLAAITSRTMSASATGAGGPSGEEDFETMRGT